MCRHILWILPLATLYAVTVIGGLVLTAGEAPSLWLVMLSAVAAITVNIFSHTRIRTRWIGVLSMLGGIVGAMVGDFLGSLPPRSPASTPRILFFGAVVGGAAWVIVLSLCSLNSTQTLRQIRDISQVPIEGRPLAVQHLIIALLSFLIGPSLGLLAFVIYHLVVGVEPADSYPVFGVSVAGGMGALLSHMTVGTIVGILLGVPYLLASMVYAAGCVGRDTPGNVYHRKCDRPANE